METKKNKPFSSSPMSNDIATYIIIFPNGFIKAEIDKKVHMINRKFSSAQ